MDNSYLIIGATSSLAQSICRTLAKKGHTLILTGRDENELELLAGDLVARYNSSCRIVIADLMASGFSPERFIAQAGDFDHAILATGDMGSGNAGDIADLDFTARINYIIPAQLATLAATHLAAKKGGSIAIISSVAGDRGRQSNYAYGSAKAALSTFASGLRNRFCKQNVHVMTVKPGFTDTPMTWGMQSPLMASRESVAEAIVKALEKKKNVVYVPFFWRYIMLIIIHIPEFIFKKLKL